MLSEALFSKVFNSVVVRVCQKVLQALQLGVVL